MQTQAEIPETAAFETIEIGETLLKLAFYESLRAVGQNDGKALAAAFDVFKEILEGVSNDSF